MQILIINGINASPLLLNEEQDHFHCILRGHKKIVLINMVKYPDVRKVNSNTTIAFSFSLGLIAFRLLYRRKNNNKNHR